MSDFIRAFFRRYKARYQCLQLDLTSTAKSSQFFATFGLRAVLTFHYKLALCVLSNINKCANIWNWIRYTILLCTVSCTLEEYFHNVLDLFESTTFYSRFKIRSLTNIWCWLWKMVMLCIHLKNWSLFRLMSSIFSIRNNTSLEVKTSKWH